MTGRLPKIFRRLFANEGAGPLLREDIVPRQDRNYLCEFYYFRHPTLKPGFQPAQGGIIENAPELYPEAWAYLQTSEGQKLCKSEAGWQDLTRTNWATLADGSTVSWNGIGGAPFYAPNMATGALRLPDLRGMYAEAAGYDSLGVGGVHIDTVRRMSGVVLPRLYQSENNAFSLEVYPTTSNGALYVPYTSNAAVVPTATYTKSALAGIAFDNARVMPVGAKNSPRAWGALACVYLGAPSDIHGAVHQAA